MGRKNNILIVLCSLALFFGSCEKQRFLNVPFANTKYVIHGLFSNNEPCKLEISKSQALNDTSAIKNVSTADAFLYEGDNYLEKLSYTPPAPGKILGTYTSNFKNFVQAKKYSINVEVDGNEIISSSDVISNMGADILNFTGPITVDTTSQNLFFDLDIQQPNTVKQYFHIFLQQRWVQYSLNPVDSNLLYSIWFNKRISPEQNPPGFIPTPSEPFSLNVGGSLQGIMLDNDNFNGLTKSIPFSANNFNQQLPNMYLESRVIVRSVSANYFKYYFSSSQYHRTKGTPLTEPVIIHNNITNGLGNFSGYTAVTSAIVRRNY